MTDLISIIMPAFAVEKHLLYFEKAISGIVNQTYTTWELIITCDGGGRATLNCILNVLKKYNDKRIKLFKSSEQYGPGIIRNISVKYAKGKYLTFHDTDDYSEPTRFEKLISSMDNDGITASNVVIKEVYDGVKSTMREKSYSGNTFEALIKDRKVKVPIHFPSAIILTSLFKDLGGFEKYKYSSDAIMAIKLSYYRELLNLPAIPVIKEPLFVWNRHSHSVTTLASNSYILKKCQSAQRKPLKRVFRESYLKGIVKKGDDKKRIKRELGLGNNLVRLPDLIRIK